MTAAWTTIESIDPGDPDIAIWARIHYDLDLATECGTRIELFDLCAGPVADRWVILEFDPDLFVAVCGLVVLQEAAWFVQLRGGHFAVVNPPVSLRRLRDHFQLALDLPMYADASMVPVRSAGAAQRA